MTVFMQSRFDLTQDRQHLVIETNQSSGLPTEARWSRACRNVQNIQDWKLAEGSQGQPKSGDVALVEVTEVGNHTGLITDDNQRLRIYTGDKMVCVFGNRYATDAFEGETEGTENLNMLTAGGMIGTVKSKHHSVKSPTKIKFLGFVCDANGQQLNLKDLKFGRPRLPQTNAKNVIFAVGSGMNSAKPRPWLGWFAG